MLFDLMRVGLLTGCRISEPCQLRTADMRTEGRAFRISHGKRSMPGASYQFTDQLGRSCSSALHARQTAGYARVSRPRGRTGSEAGSW